MTHRLWSGGLRARLLLAFFGIAAFAIVAAAAGLYAFREVGARLDVLDTRIPPTLSALELSRSAERIIATAPALLAASDASRRDETTAALAREVNHLHAQLAELKSYGPNLQPLLQIEPIVTSLTASLATLESLVARRVETSDRIAGSRSDVFRANYEADRLLSPWLEVMGAEIAALIKDGERGALDQESERLASLMETQHRIQSAQAQVSTVADMLAEASTTERPERLSILAFQLGLALHELEAIGAGLDPKLAPIFLEQVASLRRLSEDSDAIVATRQQELSLVQEGENLLAETRSHSADLTAAVDQLGVAAKQDIGDAIADALSVQRYSARVLLVLVALSLLTSILIVWLYVGHNLVGRLSALSNALLAIAGGSLRTPVAVPGSDEIAAMGRAVEVFRQNTLERDGLLAERAEAADRLEKEVIERTAELAQSVAEVEEKSRQLEAANQYKARFLASASHDLRQPLHALNLLLAQLPNEAVAEERSRLVAKISAAVGSMNELLDALLDMSKLDAGVLQAETSEFPLQPLLARIETTFAGAALEKGLRLHLVPTSAWVRSDFILLERIMMNLVANAVRYTSRGGVVVGCRRRGAELRIDICDSGSGIPREQRQSIFGEFFQLPAPNADRRGGLGLGLSIVDRLASLLEHRIELRSDIGRGSRFSIIVPIAVARSEPAEALVPLATLADPLRGKLVVAIDDDPLVLESMGGIFRNWGCAVVAATSPEAALPELKAFSRKPDLIISDYRLSGGRTGIEAIRQLRLAFEPTIPALLISGDTAPELLREASESGYPLLYKPVMPMRLRAMCNRLIQASVPSAAAAITRLRSSRRPAGARDRAPPLR